jgi:thioredoxin-like negative regulator of GroEL
MIGDLEILAPALTVAALIEQARGRSPAAVRLVDELVVASDRHSGWQYAQQLLDLVRIYVVAGRVEVADDLVRRMNSPAPRHRYSRVTAQAVMAEARNDLESAAHGYQEAAVQWTTYGHALEAANAHLSLGRCMLLMHRLEAQNSLRQAQHGFSRLAARPLLAQTNRLLRQSRGST